MRIVRSPMKLALAVVAVGLLSLAPATPAAADPGEPKSASHVFFWETWGYSDDRVELGPAPAGYNLRNVTRDCVVFCWNDWDNVPTSVWVQPRIVLTVWDLPNRSGSCANFDGGPESSPGSAAPGRGWYDLLWVGAGLPAGQNWDKRISAVLLTPYGTTAPGCAWA